MELEGLLEDLKNSLFKINNNEAIKIFEEMVQNVLKDSVDIIFIGEKSSGKSTIVNKLINRNILPTGIGTATFNIFSIKKGKTDDIEVEYLNGTKAEFSLDEGNLSNIQEDYKSIKKINVFLKDIPQNKVNILDVPGVGDVDENLTEFVKNVIPITDSIVIVLDVSRGLTKNIVNILNSDDVHKYKDKLFIIFNKLDTIPEDELNENLPKLENEIKKYYKTSNLYFITTKNIYSQLNQLEKFKTDIYEYIEKVEIKDILNSKIGNYLGTIKHIIDSYIEEIKIINGNTKNELNEKLEKFNIEKDSLEKKFDDFKSDLENNILQIKECINGKVRDLEDSLINITKQENLIDKRNEIDRNIKSTIDEIKTNCVNVYLDKTGKYFNFDLNIDENSFTKIIHNLGKFTENISSLISTFITEEKLPPFLKKIFDVVPRTTTFFEEKLSFLDSVDEKIKEIIEQFKKLIYDDIRKIQVELEMKWDSEKLSPLRGKMQLLEGELEKLNNEKDIVELKTTYYIEEQTKVNSIIEKIEKNMEINL